MKLSLNVRPLRALGAALFDHGLRMREECDELILNHGSFHLRLHLVEKSGGDTIRCFVSVAETRLIAGSFDLFNEMSLEGYPVDDFGSCRGQATFEFGWFHPQGADWQISAQRCQGLVDRVIGALTSWSKSKLARADGKPVLRP